MAVTRTIGVRSGIEAVTRIAIEPRILDRVFRTEMLIKDSTVLRRPFGRRTIERDYFTPLQNGKSVAVKLSGDEFLELLFAVRKR